VCLIYNNYPSPGVPPSQGIDPSSLAPPEHHLDDLLAHGQVEHKNNRPPKSQPPNPKNHQAVGPAETGTPSPPKIPDDRPEGDREIATPVPPRLASLA